MDEQRRVAAVIDDELRTFAVRMRERLVGAPPIFFERFAFPREDRHAGLRDRRRGVILRRKILHEAQRTLAPRSTSVSINTAVWIVMCSEPVTRTPASGFCAYFSRIAIKPGISFSAMEISFRPKSARPMSLTLKSCFVFCPVDVS